MSAAVGGSSSGTGSSRHLRAHRRQDGGWVSIHTRARAWAHSTLTGPVDPLQCNLLCTPHHSLLPALTPRRDTLRVRAVHPSSLRWILRCSAQSQGRRLSACRVCRHFSVHSTVEPGRPMRQQRSLPAWPSGTYTHYVLDQLLLPHTAHSTLCTRYYCASTRRTAALLTTPDPIAASARTVRAVRCPRCSV